MILLFDLSPGVKELPDQATWFWKTELCLRFVYRKSSLFCLTVVLILKKKELKASESRMIQNLFLASTIGKNRMITLDKRNCRFRLLGFGKLKVVFKVTLQSIKQRNATQEKIASGRLVGIKLLLYFFHELELSFTELKIRQMIDSIIILELMKIGKNIFHWSDQLW